MTRKLISENKIPSEEKGSKMKSHKISVALSIAVVMSLIVSISVFAGHAADGADVEITIDNNNVDGGTPNPSFDTQNRQANETSVAFSPANPSIIAVGANDYRMVPVFGDAWLG
ncbi:MAG TPA: hypothetical protein VI524_11550, partial [Anaerolineales bacterium]|nr:hypothetical protein [Anaerolineales bacterium]